MQIAVAVSFPLLCCTSSLTQYTQFKQQCSDLTCDLTATFSPVNLFNCIPDSVFADFVDFFSVWNWLETYWVVILSLISSSAPQFVCFVRLTPFELWVKAITHTLWVEAIPSASCYVLIPVFPQCLAVLITNRNGWHSYSAQIRLCDEVLYQVQEKMIHVPACASTCLMGGRHFDPRRATRCDCSFKVGKGWKPQTVAREMFNRCHCE